HNAKSLKACLGEFGVKELVLSAQSPDLNPINKLWDEVEWRLRARPSPPTSVSSQCACGWAKVR
ncbi:hypothetical protein P4O66_019319, partial [Electrophorus voltai]